MTADAKPGRDRVTRVRLRGLRTAANVEFDCEPMNVLIGPNGVGKSTLIEGLEILHKIPWGESFLRALNDEHGGVSHLLRLGSSEIELGLDIANDKSSLSYRMTLARRDGSLVIEHESLYRDGVSDPLFVREGDRYLIGGAGLVKPTPRWPVLVVSSASDPLAERVVAALAGIEVHVPFATQARWFGTSVATEGSMRSDNIIQSTSRLERGGANLANAYHALRNRADWFDTLSTIRLLVDDDITDVTTPAAASGGSIGLAASYRGSGSVPAFALSDGTLALFALIAVARLDGGNFPRSLLAVDEPDLHLHPGAIGQVIALLEECSAAQPVVIATHSDRLLDSLSQPAKSAVLCDLDEHRRLRLRRPDSAQLDRWLEEYRGLGHIRAEGYDQLVFPPPRIAEKA